MTKSDNSSTRYLIVATTAGSVLEMYDFVIYSFFAIILGKLFFPSQQALVQLIATYGIFALGYLARPLGGIIFGHIADRFGRRNGLAISVVSMGIPIVALGLLPTYQSIGIWAPILLTVVRVFQGLSVGGEFPSAATFLSEHAPPSERGFETSWLFFGINGGILLASLVGYVVTESFHANQTALLSWGWRIPFLLGGVLAAVGYYIRRNLGETHAFQELKYNRSIEKIPFMYVLRHHMGDTLKGFGATAAMASAISLIYLYMPTYLTQFVHLPLSTALLFNAINLVVLIVMLPIMGKWSDYFSRRVVTSIGGFLLVFNTYPFLWLINSFSHSPYLILWALCMMGVFTACTLGPIAAMLAELFATKARTSGVAILII